MLGASTLISVSGLRVSELKIGKCIIRGKEELMFVSEKKELKVEGLPSSLGLLIAKSMTTCAE